LSISSTGEEGEGGNEGLNQVTLLETIRKERGREGKSGGKREGIFYITFQLAGGLIRAYDDKTNTTLSGWPLRMVKLRNDILKARNVVDFACGKCPCTYFTYA